MANTLTAITPEIYEAMDIVAREQVGMIPAVNKNSSAERAAKGQTVTYPIVPAVVGEDITPGNTPADSGDATIGSGAMTISKSRAFPVRWTGEEQQLLRTGDTAQLANVTRDRFAQAIRAAVNEIESDLAALHIHASRAYGTAATAPFGTIDELDDAAEVLRILEENGSPTMDNHLVLNAAAVAKLRGYQGVMFKANESGYADARARGELGELFQMPLHQSGQIATFTKGTAASATTDNAGYAVGAKTLTLASAGTGTILAGDVLTFAGDTNQYVVLTGDADVSNGGTIVLANPGLKVAMSAATKAITVVGTSARNMCFHRNAIQLVTRKPAMPDGGDDADDVMEIVDPVSGLVFEVAMYRQYRRVKTEVAISWGVEASKPEFISLLLG